ncbi:MAG: hypothetical protein OXH85_04965 [Truepera sp.]|nr:hypothetical protein [Truepera sp.]
MLTYRVELELVENEQALSRAQRRAGRSILATNELSESRLLDALVLTLYKGRLGRPRAVVFDAQFSTRLALRSLRFMGIPFVGRCRTDLWVVHRKQRKVKGLARQFPPGRARYYRRFGFYAKRVRVVLEEVGRVSSVLIWKGAGEGWECPALVASVREGVQGVLEIWGLRWKLESSHRLYKQAFGLGRCLCRRFAAHLKHADFVLEAFHEVRLERLRSPSLTWRRAQEVVAARRGNAVLTGTNALVA